MTHSLTEESQVPRGARAIGSSGADPVDPTPKNPKELGDEENFDEKARIPGDPVDPTTKWPRELGED